MALGRIGGCIRILLHDCPSKGLLCGRIQSDCMACRVGAKRHLLLEDVVKLQEFQQRKQAVAHQVSGSKTLGSSSPAFIKKPEFAQEVVDLVRLRSEDSPLMARVEQAVSHLQQAGQVNQRNVDEMLCHTPMGKKRMPMGIMDERRISRRTLRPLQSTLLSE
ncbi:pentatricopeptide repeat-containing protein 2, mitochondrial-like isoform 1-T2 [Salvelinus alpinus]|uniref:pentatricopeptide repeat-containing protein 2, mitochondrial-like isoform X1 n=1 Tax=Salvelinus alpinus TaxID=8036 RepID=UPI0039FBA252